MNNEKVESVQDPIATRTSRIWRRFGNLATAGKVYRASRVFIASFWVIALSLLAWLVWRSRDTLVPYLLDANYWRLLVALPFYLGTIVASVIGWSIIMRSFARPLSIWLHVRIYCSTLAARRIPGTVWYIGGRLVLYAQAGIPRTVVSLASAVELVVATVAGITIGLLLIPIGYSVPGNLVAVLLAGVVGGMACLHPSVLGRLMRWLGHPLQQPIGLRALIQWFLAYAAMWLMGGLMISQIVSAFWALEVRQIILIVGAWALSGAGGLLTIFLPSSFGVTELGMTFFLAQVMPLPLAAAIAIVARILTTLAELVLSISVFPFLRRSQDVSVDPAVDRDGRT